jgi:hypothetical protein
LREIDGEAADDGHVLGPVAFAIAGEVILEKDFGQSVHTIDAPVSASASGKAIDVARCARVVIMRVETAAIGVFDSIDEPQDRRDVGETLLAQLAAIGGDPIREALCGVIPALLNIDTRPVSCPNGSDAVLADNEEAPGALAGVEDVLAGGPDEGAEFVLSQIGPDVLHRVQFRRIGRQQQQSNVVWNLQLPTSLIPAGAVTDEDGVSA